ncbi:MAG: galactokinase [Phycisphaerae bacterium]|nr:galactokinase [Phycisphaerae bacterium]
MLSDRVRAAFYQMSGHAPTVVASAPGRVNLIGEHVDYADGLVLPMAIERRTAIALGPATGRSRCASAQFDGVWQGTLAGEIRPIRSGSDAAPEAWINYALGPLAELRHLGVDLGEIDCAIVSDVPPGGGVSSSAALEVAMTTAALALAQRTLSGIEIARLCQRAEHRFPQTPCGIMDMTVSANARAGHALLIDCRSLELRHLPMPAGAQVVVFDSGVRHRLSDGGYASRRAAVEGAAKSLGMKALRDLSPESLPASAPVGLEAISWRRARHVVSEIARTACAAEALAKGDTARFGSLMNASHASLRDDFDVSVPEIDVIVEAACAAEGTFGARLTGGGFGGCAIALVRADLAEQVIEHVNRKFVARFGRTPNSFATGADMGARLE